MSFRHEIALAKRRSELYPPPGEDVFFSAVRR
jgi:hypothetical protein